MSACSGPPLTADDRVGPAPIEAAAQACKDCVAPVCHVEHGTRVLYASYGSNLLRERLLVYILGGSIHGNQRVFPGARCRASPARDVTIRVPYRLRFAREGRNWGQGGVCFLDVSRAVADEEREGTVVRGYELSLAQFNCIVRQENDHTAEAVPQLSPAQLRQLVDAGPGSAVCLLRQSWYGHLVFLGVGRVGVSAQDAAVDDLPLLTFTSDPDELRGLPHNPPSPAYLSVILRGLLQCGLSRAAALRYLLARAQDAPEEGGVDVPTPAAGGGRWDEVIRVDSGSDVASGS